MNYKFLIILLLSLFIFSCETSVDYKIKGSVMNFFSGGYQYDGIQIKLINMDLSHLKLLLEAWINMVLYMDRVKVKKNMQEEKTLRKTKKKEPV